MLASCLSTPYHRLASIPAIAIHGRHDNVCPVGIVYALHQRWPQLEVRIVPLSGHSHYGEGKPDGLGMVLHFCRDCLSGQILVILECVLYGVICFEWIVFFLRLSKKESVRA